MTGHHYELYPVYENCKNARKKFFIKCNFCVISKYKMPSYKKHKFCLKFSNNFKANYETKNLTVKKFYFAQTCIKQIFFFIQAKQNY